MEKVDIFSIKDLSEGKCAIENTSTIDDLNKVLRAAFPECSLSGGRDLYYYKRTGGSSWVGSNTTDLPVQSTKTFLDEELEYVPAIGDKILVSDDLINWNTRIFIAFNHESILCVNPHDEQTFRSNTGGFRISVWKFYKKIPKTILKVTLIEVAEKFGVDEVMIVR